MKITEIDYTTNPETVTKRDATAKEIAQWKADQAADLARQNEVESKANAKAALLERLGMTAEEATLLLS